jgi:pyruvate dehydrogenase E1 component
VRGNGKIIQELEGDLPRRRLERHQGDLGHATGTRCFAATRRASCKKRMMECVDGEYQTFKAKDGAYVREHFFNTPELKALVADWTDDEVWR